MATLAQVQATLALYRAARDAILTGAQSVSIGQRALTRADLATLNKEIKDLERQEEQLGGATTSRRLVGHKVIIRDI